MSSTSRVPSSLKATPLIQVCKQIQKWERQDFFHSRTSNWEFAPKSAFHIVARKHSRSTGMLERRTTFFVHKLKSTNAATRRWREVVNFSNGVLFLKNGSISRGNNGEMARRHMAHGKVHNCTFAQSVHLGDILTTVLARYSFMTLSDVKVTKWQSYLVKFRIFLLSSPLASCVGSMAVDPCLRWPPTKVNQQIFAPKGWNTIIIISPFTFLIKLEWRRGVYSPP